MAAQNSTPSDLYKCVYSFLLENKFTKAAQQFLKQTKVVSGSAGAAVKLIGCSVGVLKLREQARNMQWCPALAHVQPQGLVYGLCFGTCFFFPSRILTFWTLVMLSHLVSRSCVAASKCYIIRFALFFCILNDSFSYVLHVFLSRPLKIKMRRASSASTTSGSSECLLSVW